MVQLFVVFKQFMYLYYDISNKVDCLVRCCIGAITAADFQGKTLETIKEFPAEEAIEVLRDINSSTLVHVANKSAYVCGLLKTHKQRKSSVSASHSHGSDAHRKGPDDAKMKVVTLPK